MRINPNTYPAYYNIQSDESIYHLEIDMGITQMFKDQEQAIDMLKGIRSVYKQGKHKYYVTQPFLDALYKASPKIMKEMKHWQYDKPDAGVFFLDSGFTLYLLNPPDRLTKAILYGFSKGVLTSFAFVMMDGTIVGRWIRKGENGETVNDRPMLEQWVNGIMCLFFFINEVDTDEYIVPAGQKSKTKKNDPTHIYNETKHPITVLDCRWFTDIIRDDPFWVSGHWRWQPVGPGRSKRRMQWIRDFQKEGYTRKATKDNLEL